MARLIATWSETSEWSTPRFRRHFGELGEEALDGVQPRRRGRREVEGPSRVAAKPGADFGLLVGGVVIDDSVHQLAGRDLILGGIEEADELLVPMALHAAAQ
jgi:hypothetical protein